MQRNFFNTAIILAFVLIGLAAACSDESSDPADGTSTETEDSTSPTLSNSSLTLTPSGTAPEIQVDWIAASDETTPSDQIVYKVVYSTTDNVSTLAEAEANGTVAIDFTANISSYNVTGLIGSSTYYFNVIAKDAAGNKSIYTKGSAIALSCFLPETLITMADGSLKRIDEISIGEKVLSFDEDGRISISQVGQVLKLASTSYLEISTRRNSVRATPSHEFYVGSQAKSGARYPGFQAIGGMFLGEFLFSYNENNSLEPDQLVSSNLVNETVEVFSLVMSKGPPTFFANSFAVHNGS